MKKILNTETLIELNLEKEINITKLPVKIIQFGTGVLLRGLIDDIIHKANLQGVYNGRIIIVKSTEGNPEETKSFKEQNNLFTNGVRGVLNGEVKKYDYINSSVSGVLSAKSEWSNIKDIALSDAIEIIISNTTESGLTYVDEIISENSPESYSGKLCALLYARYKNNKKGLVIIPTELLSDNGKIVRDNVVKMAVHNNLEESFMKWVVTENYFCSSLVDRIVPGRPDSETAELWNEELPYEDKLKFISEPFGLWAIEGDDKIKEICSFATVAPEVKIDKDITIYKELKLRLLNASHSALTAYALLSGFQTVYQAMVNNDFRLYAEAMMKNEIALGIPYKIDEQIKSEFADSVLDRFANPFLKHYWKDIAFSYTNKIRIRIVPVIVNYYQITGSLPDKLIKGIACYLHLYQKAEMLGNDFVVKTVTGSVKLNDEHIKTVKNKLAEGYEALFSDDSLWGADLSAIPGFVDEIERQVNNIVSISAI